MGWLAWVLAALCAVLCGLAVLSHLGGNPTAINGIIGAGFGVVLFVAIGLIDRR